MKTIAIIPARGGSKRLPNKNVLLLDGIPLLAHSILYAQANNTIIDEVYVSTNDENIKEIALEYGAKIINRPENLSGDFEPTITAVKHVLEVIGKEVSNVVLLQATNPLRPKNLLNEAFDAYQKSNSDSLFTVSRSHHKLGKIVVDKFVPYNYFFGQRSQDLEPLYYENGLLYISKATTILNEILLSENAIPFEVNHIFANVDIDTQDDFDYASFLINKNKNK